MSTKEKSHMATPQAEVKQTNGLTVPGNIAAMAEVKDDGTIEINHAALAADVAIAKALTDAAKSKSDEWEQEAQDFWKPTTIGDTLVGVYINKERQARYFVHMFAVPHPKTNKPMVMRVNGSRILSKELAKGEFGKVVKLVFQGVDKTDAGQKLNKFDVLWKKS